MKVLIIDNYDSFTFDLYQYIGEILASTDKKFILNVVRNDRIALKEIEKSGYDKIIISPGPGDPSDKKYFGVCSGVITEIGKNTPVLGVCLGMQGIFYCFGGDVIRAKAPMHGKTSILKHNGKGLFHNVPQEIEVMRYHSLIADEKSLPETLEITAKAVDTNEIMGIRHRKFPIEGVQFHPESFATEAGKIILENFIKK